MESCYISSSSAPWWTTRGPHGSPLPIPIVWKLHVLQSKCLRLAIGAPACFDSNLADVGNPLIRQLVIYLRWPRVDPLSWRESQARQGPEGQSRPSSAVDNSAKRIAFGADHRSAFRLQWLRFFRVFSSVIRQMPGYKIQSVGTARTQLPQARRLHLNAWKLSRTSSLRLSRSGLITETPNQPKFFPPLISPGAPRL